MIGSVINVGAAVPKIEITFLTSDVVGLLDIVGSPLMTPKCVGMYLFDVSRFHKIFVATLTSQNQ